MERLRRLGLAISIAMLAQPIAARAQEAPRPAHPSVRYSCMSDPPGGDAWPWVAAGVPQGIEVLHPGYSIDPYERFAVPGLRLFVVAGMRRSEAVSERYAQVEAVDEHDTFLAERPLFLRSIAGVTDPYAMALRAMAILMRRADERPLRAAPSGIADGVRDRIVAPSIRGRTLTFWIRNRADQPYASLIDVDLDAGTLSGDPG